MTTAWCPHCSHPNPYETVRPRLCAKCEKDMTAAFAPVTVASSPAPTHYQPPAPAPAPATNLRRPTPLYGSYDNPDADRNSGGEFYHREEVEARAAAWAERLSDLSFDFHIDDDKHKGPVKLGTIETFREAVNAVEKTGEAPKKRSRKKS